MDKGRGNFPPGWRMTFAPLIALAYPRRATKHLEAALGCSPRQAQRIVETGRAPNRFQATLKKILLRAMEANQRALERHIEALRVGDHAEMVTRAADRRASANRDRAQAPAGPAGRAAKPLLTSETLHD